MAKHIEHIKAHINFASFVSGTYLFLKAYTLVSEVRKYTLDMNINTKIPEQEFHKLWFYQSRIKFQGLCVHPFNFKILGLSAIFSAIIQSAVCQDFLLFFVAGQSGSIPEKIVEKKPLLRHGWDEWIFVCVYDRQSYHLKTCKYYRNIPKNAKYL